MSTNKRPKLTYPLFEPKQNQKKSFVKYSYNSNKSDEPKRNKSAFAIFSSQTRVKLKEQGQESLNPNEMMIRLGEMWKNLSKEERKPYEEEAHLDKIRYCEELENFWKDNPSKGLENKTKANHVKKPCSAYGLFLRDIKDEVKAQNLGYKMADILKLVSDRWKTLDKSAKAIYQAKAKKEKEEAKNKLNEHYSKLKNAKEGYEKKKEIRLSVLRKKINSLPKAADLSESNYKSDPGSPETRTDSDDLLIQNQILFANATTWLDFNECSSTIETSITRTESIPNLNNLDFEDPSKITEKDFVDKMLNLDYSTVSVKGNMNKALELGIPALNSAHSRKIFYKSIRTILDSDYLEFGPTLMQSDDIAKTV